MQVQNFLKIYINEELLRSHRRCCCNSATLIILFLCHLFDPQNAVSFLYTDSSVKPAKISKLFGTKAGLSVNLVPRVCHHSTMASGRSR